MAQLTIYMNEYTLKKIETAAKREHDSLSQWVKKHLEEVLKNAWPENYFKLFGILSEEKFERPKQPDYAQDIKRESL